jgi:hypothetical protein
VDISLTAFCLTRTLLCAFFIFFVCPMSEITSNMGSFRLIGFRFESIDEQLFANVTPEDKYRSLDLSRSVSCPCR